jgi:hypothetical protein
MLKLCVLAGLVRAEVLGGECRVVDDGDMAALWLRLSPVAELGVCYWFCMLVVTVVQL